MLHTMCSPRILPRGTFTSKAMIHYSAINGFNLVRFSWFFVIFKNLQVILMTYSLFMLRFFQDFDFKVANRTHVSLLTVLFVVFFHVFFYFLLVVVAILLFPFTAFITCLVLPFKFSLVT